MPKLRSHRPLSYAPVLLYGMLLAGGALLLDWINFQRFTRSHAGDLYLFLIAAAFLTSCDDRKSQQSSVEISTSATAR